MNDVVISSSPADAEAVETVKQHHAELSGALSARVSAVYGAAQAGHGLESARDDMVAWCEAELLPHARAEEASLYPAGQAMAQARMLVEAMVTEHGVLSGLVEELRGAANQLRTVGLAQSLQVLFSAHVTKENDQLLPLLATAPEVSLTELLGGMHQVFAEERTGHAAPAEPDADAHAGHTCSCGEHDAAGDPELDARAVPHAIRHATVFGALDAVRPGAGLVLVAPHDPIPLLAQIEQRDPGAFEVSYLQRGPEAWRLRFLRRAS